MAQSFVYNYVHIIFSTKNRTPLIDEEIEQDLFGYLGGICKNLKCTPLKVGGYKDHVHILCILAKDISLMKLIQEVKSYSSKWIKTKGNEYSNFYWQRGYACISVNLSQLKNVESYIENQKQHHTKRTFQEEYRLILDTYYIEYDERYMWD